MPMRRVGTPEEVAAAGVVPLLAGGRLHHPAGDLGERGHVVSRRVVVTGMGGVTALGNDWPAIRAASRMPATPPSAACGLGSLYRHQRASSPHPIPDLSVEQRYPRKKTAHHGPGRADGRRRHGTGARPRPGLLEQSGARRAGRTRRLLRLLLRHVAPVLGFRRADEGRGTSRTLNATSYIQMMSHTARGEHRRCSSASTGRIIPTSSACTSGSQGDRLCL